MVPSSIIVTPNARTAKHSRTLLTANWRPPEIRMTGDDMTNNQSEEYTPLEPGAENDPTRPAVPADEIPEDENFVDEPLADKSDMTAPSHDSEDPVNNAVGVPGVDPDQIDALRDESRQEIDLTEGRIRDVTLTQGRSVIDAEFDDRGPATHTQSDEEE